NFEWHNKEHSYFEAVIGATVARELDIKLGEEISPSHGDPEGHKHARKFTVVGILRASGTPNDRAVFINMEGFYLMEDHAKPLQEEKQAATNDSANLSDDELRERMRAAAKQKAAIEYAVDPEP